MLRYWFDQDHKEIAFKIEVWKDEKLIKEIGYGRYWRTSEKSDGVG